MHPPTFDASAPLPPSADLSISHSLRAPLLPGLHPRMPTLAESSTRRLGGTLALRSQPGSEGWMELVGLLVGRCSEPLALTTEEGDILMANRPFRERLAVPDSQVIAGVAGHVMEASTPTALDLPASDGGVIHGVAIRTPPGVLVLTDTAVDATSALRALLEALPRAGEICPTRGPWAGLPDRRSICLQMDQLRGAARASRQQLGVLLVDVDHLAALNALHGRAAGDAVLAHMVHTVARFLRASDRFGRYGGEDFVALLNNCDRVGAMLVAERIRAAVEAMRVPWNGGELAVTVSIGVVSDIPGESLDALLERADGVTFSAKHSGRNRIAAED